MGLSSSPSGSAIQFLHLSTGSLDTPLPVSAEVGENVLWDPNRNLILSPDEEGNFDILKLSGGTFTEFNNSFGLSGGLTFDQAGEDCATGIAIATDEFGDTLSLVDLGQVAYGSGAWTGGAISQVSIPEWSP